MAICFDNLKEYKNSIGALGTQKNWTINRLQFWDVSRPTKVVSKANLATPAAKNHNITFLPILPFALVIGWLPNDRQFITQIRLDTDKYIR